MLTPGAGRARRLLAISLLVALGAACSSDEVAAPRAARPTVNAIESGNAESLLDVTDPLVATQLATEGAPPEVDVDESTWTETHGVASVEATVTQPGAQPTQVRLYLRRDGERWLLVSNEPIG